VFTLVRRGSLRFIPGRSLFGIDRTANDLDNGGVNATRGQAGVGALSEALSQVGLTLDARSRGARREAADAVVRSRAGDECAVVVKQMSLANIDALQRLSLTTSPAGDEAEPVLVVVADRIPQPSRAWLGEHDVSWLDLRGHLRLVTQGFFIDADVTPQRERPVRSSALAGRVGLEVATLLLTEPGIPPGVRAIASRLDRSASTVSEVLKILREQELVDRYGLTRPADLFWEVAAVWRPDGADLARVPDPDDRAVSQALGLERVQVEGTRGWALTDTLAAMSYGAPAGARTDHPPDFYVPEAATLRRAVQLLGAARTTSSRVATVRVAPVPMVCEQRVDPLMLAAGKGGWPLAHPLFVALDLARDPGRGREILDAWTPPKPWKRVW
jgi:hypothetical protein